MLDVLQVFTLIVVVLAMIPALAHALELPGKLRLEKEAYVTVQPIYYPGFTVAGMSEPLAILLTAILAIRTPSAGADFVLTLVALLGLLAMQAVYWLLTHPVNNFWLEGQSLSTAGATFFSFASGRKGDGQSDTGPADWTKLRDRWEYSHVARAVLAFLSFIALAIAISSTGGA
jgi:hypothetical protein